MSASKKTPQATTIRIPSRDFWALVLTVPVPRNHENHFCEIALGLRSQQTTATLQLPDGAWRLLGPEDVRWLDHAARRLVRSGYFKLLSVDQDKTYVTLTPKFRSTLESLRDRARDTDIEKLFARSSLVLRARLFLGMLRGRGSSVTVNIYLGPVKLDQTHSLANFLGLFDDYGTLTPRGEVFMQFAAKTCLSEILNDVGRAGAEHLKRSLSSGRPPTADLRTLALEDLLAILKCVSLSDAKKHLPAMSESAKSFFAGLFREVAARTQAAQAA